MSKEPKTTNQSVPLRESFSGVSSLQPSAIEKKSVDGAANLAPKAPPSSATTTVPVAPEPAAAPLQAESPSAAPTTPASQDSGSSGE